MSPTTTTVTATAPFLLPLLPVLVGGLIGLAGALGGGILTHRLKTADEERKVRATKIEELMYVVFEHNHWLESLNYHRSFGTDPDPGMSPFPKVRAISALYFPEMKDLIKEMRTTSDACGILMIDAAKERIANGRPSEAHVNAVTAAFKPYHQALYAVVHQLEDMAVKRK